MSKSLIQSDIPERELRPVEVRLSDPSTAGGIHFLDSLIVIAKRKWTIVCTTFACAILCAIWSLLLPKIYLADTKMLPPQQTQSVASAMLGQLGPLTAMAGKDLGLRNPNDIYVTMLQSRTVSEALIRKFDLMTVYKAKRLMDARKRLAQDTDIDSGKDGVITISVQDRDPKRAADMANAYVSELYNLTKSLAITEAAQRRLFFEQQLRSANEDLVHAEQDFQKVQENTGLIQLDNQAKAIIEAISAARGQIAAKEVQITAMKAFATPQNPDLIRAENEIEAMKAHLATLEHNQRGPAGEPQLAAGKVPSAGLQYVRGLRDVKYYETVFELLSKQYEIAKMDEARSAAIIQVLDPAVPPEMRFKPKRTQIVIAGTIVGFFFSVLSVFTREAFRSAQAQPQVGNRLQLLRRYLLARPGQL